MGTNYLKDAHRMAQRGEFIDAGDLYRSAGEYEKSLEMYKKIHAYNRSASLLEWLGRYMEAARHYAKAGHYEKAAELFKQAGDFYQAGVMYTQAQIPLLAAEMFVAAKASSEAALSFENANDFQRAGEFYMERGMYGKAAACFEKILNNPFYTGKKSTDGHDIHQTIRILCARAYEKLRKYETSAEYYHRAGQTEEAVRVCRSIGDLNKAAQFLEQTGHLNQASELYQELGEIKKAQSLQIKTLLSEDRFSEAADLADRTGEFLIAAEAYEHAGEFSKAGEMYRLNAKNSKAAEMFLKAGKLLEAAILFETTGEIPEAAAIREKIGEYDKAAELYSLVNEPAKSARLYFEIHRYDECIRVLQNAWSQGQQSAEIRNLLGMAFLRRGNFDLAYDNYLKYLIEEKVTQENLEMMYELACRFTERGQNERALKLFERISAHQLDYKDVKERITELSSQMDFHASRQATTLPHHFTPGRKVAERYIIKEKVGSGGMGVVYRAFDDELGLDVALKVLKPKYSTDMEMIQRFKQEVTLARQIHHENVIQIFDFDKINNLLYITMEFFASRDLKALLRTKTALLPEELIPIMMQVCSGLWSAHRRGIIHRDIKPQNILINDGGVVKLVDFGIATVIGLNRESTTDFVVGTPEYMSPEQARGEAADIRSDIYSLGTILYETATGGPPFSNPDSFQILVDHVELDPIPPVEKNPAIPKWLNDLILKCLNKDPEQRFESVQVIGRQLATCGIAELMLNPELDED